MFDESCHQAIRKHAEDEFPREACGLVVGSGNYVRCVNVKDKPEDGFKIPQDIWARFRALGNVRAVVHSHPNGDYFPSYADQAGQLSMPEIPWGLVQLTKVRTRGPFFWGDTVPIQPLEKRPWIMGVYDCYGLVRDYYRLKFNITIPNRPRANLWWTDPKEKDLLLRMYKTDGWVDVPDWHKNIQKHDVFLIRLPGFNVATHCAIYLGNELAVHHRWDRQSIIVPVGPYLPMVDRVIRWRAGLNA